LIRLKKEKCPDGSKDENVFDIRPGVAIALFIKKKQNVETNILHADLWGLREDKYNWLLESDIKTTEWEELTPHSDFYLFIPRDERLLEVYEKYPKITEIFPLNGVGMTTARDRFVIDRDKNTLENRIRLFKNSKYSDKDLHTYRPFDVQWIFYHDSVVWRTVKRVMRHMLKENLGLCIGRAGQVVGLEKPWNIVFCSDSIDDFNLFYRGGNVNFPLYLYQDKTKSMSLDEKASKPERTPNFSTEFLHALKEVFGAGPTPEEIFYYIYVVLYSPTYRKRYDF
jgi:predicted helicase